MKVFKIYRSKKYLRSIYVWIGVALIGFVFIFSSLIFFSLKKTVENNIYESNSKLTSQIKYNIETLDQTAKNLTKELFDNPDVAYLMYNTDNDRFENTLRLDKVKKVVFNVYPFVHSFFIYNNQSKTFYSSYSGMDYTDSYLEHLVKSGNETPLLTPLFRKFETLYSNPNEKYENTFTYALYDSIDAAGLPEGAIYMNINAEWIFSNLFKINSLGQNMPVQIYLLGKNGEIISGQQDNVLIQKEIKTLYNTNIKKSLNEGKNSDFFSYKLGKNNYFINYIYIEKADWVLINLQPYNNAFSNLLKVKNIILSLSGIFLILALMMALYVSGKIYSPVGKLVKEIVGSSNKKLKEDAKNEIDFLSQTYRSAIEVANHELNERNSNKNILKNYYLRQLLTDSTVFPMKDIEKDEEKEYFDFNLNLPICICVFKVDNYREFVEKRSLRDRELYKFAVANIANEVLGSQYSNNIIDMKDDILVAVLNVGEDECDFYVRIEELLQKVNGVLNNYYRLSISSSVSRLCADYKTITKVYSEALNHVQYRMIFGRGSIIVPSMVKDNLTNPDINYPFSYDRKLSEALNASNNKETGQVVTAIMKEISKQRIENITFSIMHLLNTLRNDFIRINSTRMEPVSTDLGRLNKQILEMETLDEMQSAIHKHLDELLETEEDKQKGKYKVIVETIKELTASNYSDSGLSLQQMATMLKLSVNHVGKIFKDGTGMSVAEYVNQWRITKAAEWLRNSDLEVNQIMLKVGIENESHFYRHFKKRFNVPPKEYSLRSIWRVEDI